MPVDPNWSHNRHGMAGTIGLIASKVTAVQCGEARIAQNSKERHRSKEQKYNTHDSIALSIAHANFL